MFNMRTAGGICILLIANQTAMAQPQSNAKFLSTTSSASKAEKSPSSKSKLPAYRIEELSRRAHDPGPIASRANNGLAVWRAEYDEIVAGKDPLWQSDILRIKDTKPMPPTACKSIYLIPKAPERVTGGPWQAHDMTVVLFSDQSGFGYMRMLARPKNKRGRMVASPGIDRVELVSLMTTDEPSVYVLDELAEPPKARLAHRRPLDQFEQLGLNAVRQGQDLVGTKEAPNRMFGAIRAEEKCLECHTRAKKNDLLGAFTYYLETSVDKLVKPLPPANDLLPSYLP